MNRLLFTGTNGFLGKNVQPLLKNLGYKITSLDITDADIISNLGQEVPHLKELYDIVLHAVGKAHFIPKTEVEKQVFFDVNYHGTVNLCKGLEQSGLPKSFVFISTIAVYGCEIGENITEDYPLSGNTPDALSKIQAEQYLTEWCEKNNVILSILRPSLIAGPNPPGNLGAMVRGIKSGFYFNIARGKAKKSMLMVQDIANLLPLLIEKGGIYNICDDEQPSFGQIAEVISKQLGKKKPLSIPYFVAKLMAICGDLFGNKAPINSNKLIKITKPLTFSNEKAKDCLGWKPLNVLENFKI
jgi:nucleoside-diphosphate-sugar epimerase